MTNDRQVFTDELIAEFEGDLGPVVHKLSRLLAGYKQTLLPPFDPWWESQAGVDLYLDMVRRLNEKAPEGYYFGGHKTHPECLGYWRKP